ncbi:MAG: hypothetical protein AAFP84_13350, partial [Actinomycetota bacterium]
SGECRLPGIGGFARVRRLAGERRLARECRLAVQRRFLIVARATIAVTAPDPSRCRDGRAAFRRR